MHTAGSHATSAAGADNAAALLAQARMLRKQARRSNPVLADAYLRRAAELSLEAWSRAVRGGPVAVEDVHSAVTAV
jgi:hypothetical protein